jgi:hypothetical protein
MAATEITITIDENLPRITDRRLMLLWHLAQANPADSCTSKEPGELVTHIGWEIIRRWLRGVEPELYHHQQDHHTWWNLIRFAKWDSDAHAWVPRADVDALPPCPAPAIAEGFDSCEHGAWPCRLTTLAWQIRGLDPDKEQARIVAEARAETARHADNEAPW